MKENKGKEVANEVVKQGVQSQPRPPAGEKRKNISSRVDLGDLPSRRGREKKHKSSKPQDVKSTPLVSNQGSQYRFSILTQSPRILRLRRSRPQSMHPPRLTLPKKFLSTFFEMRTWLGRGSRRR